MSGYKPKKNKTVTKAGKVMGRPLGARNKSKLLKAQLTFDDSADLAAEVLIAIMTNDHEKLNIPSTETVPMSIRLQACKIVIDKAIANEKDKVEDEVEEAAEASKSTYSGPRVVTRAALVK